MGGEGGAEVALVVAQAVFVNGEEGEAQGGGKEAALSSELPRPILHEGCFVILELSKHRPRCELLVEVGQCRAICFVGCSEAKVHGPVVKA